MMTHIQIIIHHRPICLSKTGPRNAGQLLSSQQDSLSRIHNRFKWHEKSGRRRKDGGGHRSGRDDDGRTQGNSAGKGGGGYNGGKKIYRGVRTSLSELDSSGRFIRSSSSMRNWVGDPRFQPAADRYHLYVSLACPWSTRVLTVLYLKGLDNVIGVSVVHPTWQRTRPNDEYDQHIGWVFRTPTDPPLTAVTGRGKFDCEGCIPDWVNGAKTVRQLYQLARDTDGKYSVSECAILLYLLCSVIVCLHRFDLMTDH